jgi:hypothetical protein
MHADVGDEGERPHDAGVAIERAVRPGDLLDDLRVAEPDLVLSAAGAAPPPCYARRPVDAGVGEGDGIDGALAADHHALEAMRSDAGDHDVLLVAPAAAPRPNLDEPLHLLAACRTKRDERRSIDQDD